MPTEKLIPDGRAGGRMAVKRPMVAFLTQLLLAIQSRFTRRARLEAENLILRQQLVVLQRKSPTRVRLWNIDRLLLVWLYRLYPSLLDAIIIVQPETVVPLASTRLPRLALEVSPRDLYSIGDLVHLPANRESPAAHGTGFLRARPWGTLAAEYCTGKVPGRRWIPP